MSSTDQRASTALKILFRVCVNVGLVFYFVHSLSQYFVLTGGIKEIVFVGLILALINWIVVPILHILSLPIKLFAWIVGFFLVNMGALWIAVFIVTGLAMEGVSLTIAGGFAGWLVISFILGFCNWLVKAILK